MKEICLFILIILVLWLGSDNLKLRSEIKPFNGVLNESEVISRLKREIHFKDSIIYHADEFLPNSKDKDLVTFKKYYFNN